MQTRATEPLAGQLEKMFREYWNVVLALAQWRHLDRKNAEPIVEILAEPSRVDQGFEVAINVFTETEASLARLMPVGVKADTGKKLLCPMPGLVVSIAVTEGQEVKTGETLAVVEAMKMQNVLRAERDGTVKKIHAAAGATLAVDALILEFA